jgi:hypothetical protein
MSFISVQMAKRLGAAGRIEEAQDLAVTVRPSSSANFFVDSLDKADGTSTDFVINKNASLFNGFFNRIAVNEVVMDWGVPNVARWWGNNFFTVSVNPGSVVLGVTYTVVLPDHFYSAIDALNAIVTALNGAPGQTANFSVTTSGTRLGLGSDQDFAIVWEQSATDASVPAGSKPYYVPQNALARALFSSSQLYTGVMPAPIIAPQFGLIQYMASPLVLGTRYVDFVSPQLTYNQDLKDSTTATIVRDAIYRWYFAWDNNFGTDTFPGSPPLYPYQIYQGYKPFNQRRILPYPKQILWNPASPIGQVGFQVFDDRGRLLDTSQFTPSANFQFQMSMLLSEN